MSIAGRKLCPYCSADVPINASFCASCRSDLNSDMHIIVPDGSGFGIAVEGEVRIHGLKLANAKTIARILNQVKAAS